MHRHALKCCLWRRNLVMASLASPGLLWVAQAPEGSSLRDHSKVDFLGLRSLPMVCGVFLSHPLHSVLRLLISSEPRPFSFVCESAQMLRHKKLTTRNCGYACLTPIAAQVCWCGSPLQFVMTILQLSSSVHISIDVMITILSTKVSLTVKFSNRWQDCVYKWRTHWDWPR